MYFKQFYLGCLAHASYLIGSNGEAAVVDPQRDVDLYISEAAAQGLQIKYIIETHIHADFVSGHQALAARTGAEILFGPGADAAFTHREVRDGDSIQIGAVTLRIWETPGHTPESICIGVVDTAISDQVQKILTGDTLFVGDVGRPDLVGLREYSPERMAGMLYDSLHQKLLTLDDAVEVYPAHGAGSLCGRSLAEETFSSMGEQRRTNYALQPMSKSDFVLMMTEDLPEQPAYFAEDAALNRRGLTRIEQAPRPAALRVAAFQQKMQEGIQILDVRAWPAFGAGHIAGAMNIALNGPFAGSAGSLLALNSALLLVTDNEAEVDEAVLRLARVGIDKVQGYLAGGMLAWDTAGQPSERVTHISAEALASRREQDAALRILDVRRAPEFQSGHIDGAINIPLAALAMQAQALDRQAPLVVTCAGGYRSSAAVSILQRLGFAEVYNLMGGMHAWERRLAACRT